MPILYSVIARGSTILAKYSIISGNFDEVVLEVLKKKSNETTKHSYQYIDNIINFIIENNVYFICVTNQDYDRSLSFQFLEIIKEKFKDKYGMLIQTALPYSMNSEFSKILNLHMSQYNNDNSKIEKLESDIDNLTSVMKANLKKAVQRSDNIEHLEGASEHLYNNAVEFNRASTRVKRHFRCKNIKTIVFIGIGVAIILAIVIGLIVWSFKKNN